MEFLHASVAGGPAACRASCPADKKRVRAMTVSNTRAARTLAHSIREAFETYPNVGTLLPAMGYGNGQIEELRETIARADADLVLIGTPIDLRRLIVVAFLVSDEAAYITGASVDIHGGELIIA